MSIHLNRAQPSGSMKHFTVSHLPRRTKICFVRFSAITFRVMFFHLDNVSYHHCQPNGEHASRVGGGAFAGFLLACFPLQNCPFGISRELPQPEQA